MIGGLLIINCLVIKHVQSVIDQCLLTRFFVKPTISSAGLTESELKSQGKNYKVLTMPAASVPKSQVIGDPRGLYKCMIDPETDEILGITIYAEEAHETINVLTIAMQHHLTATDLKNHIYGHSTMTEALNELF
ncbi:MULTISPECIES: hypothetical protein [Lactiplantibacillus]|uniref:hypothetical protein n=1 Tax=Lactiplantibacillus TaxID=2767842 RepID=UPI001EDA85AE|nr:MULTISPECIES: hypothetical protein [Lactiplantibacillus]MDL2063544.1 hypothetical protein [Lactiplantibacillus paraplantarum]